MELNPDLSLQKSSHITRPHPPSSKLQYTIGWDKTEYCHNPNSTSTLIVILYLGILSYQKIIEKKILGKYIALLRFFFDFLCIMQNHDNSFNNNSNRCYRKKIGTKMIFEQKKFWPEEIFGPEWFVVLKM